MFAFGPRSERAMCPPSSWPAGNKFSAVTKKQSTPQELLDVTDNLQRKDSNCRNRKK